MEFTRDLEPKYPVGLTGSPAPGRIVSRGSAVQCMNLMLGFEETAGLTFAGLHP